MFVDEVKVELHAGNGGDGCTAFRREKYVPLGGPAGGNGGRGGDIIFRVDKGLKTLLDLRYKSIIKGLHGTPGLGKGMHGHKAEPLIVKVPPGTTVIDAETNLIIADLVKNDDEYIVAHGGRGGRGNVAFATGKNPAPEISENGEPGEFKRLKVELKLLADVGLVGLPSVGKSTIISIISAAKAKVAAYHFTTLKPNLGVVKTEDNRTFVVADLPGLIKGASLGDGLGDKFLKHIERTKVIAHVVDMGSFEGRDPYEDYITINNELDNFNPKILKKPQIIIANKMDIEGAEENLAEFKKKVTGVDIFPISATSGTGLQEVLIKLADKIDEIPENNLYEDEQFESFVLYKFREEKPYFIEKEGDVWVVKGEEVEKLLKMTKFESIEAETRFARKLRKMGIDDELERIGAIDGDTIRILTTELEFRN